jgi:hypothetical protein
VSACADLTAVSDFAKLSSNVTASTSAISSYPEAAAELARMAPPASKQRTQTEADRAAAETKVAQLGLKTLSLYFATLAALADDKTVDVKSSASSIAGSLKTLGAIKPSIVDPATALITILLTAPLDAWRRSAVANLIDRANIPVQTLSRDLANFARIVALKYHEDRLQANIYYESLAKRSSDPAVRAMLKEWDQLHVTHYQQLEDQATAAQEALQAIEQAHADLQARKSKLSSSEVKALLAKYADDIFKASSLFITLH